MLRIPHCLDSRLTDGGKFVSLTHVLRSTPQDLVRLEGLGKLKQFSYRIGCRNRALPACITVPRSQLYCVPL
jgi:hypothetical protein